MNKTVFYPGNAPATSLDNKLWLPDIVTYASDTLHFACILHLYLSAATLPGQVQLGANGASDIRGRRRVGST